MIRILGIILWITAGGVAHAQGNSLSLVAVAVSDLPTIPIDTNTAQLESKEAFKSALQKQLAQCLRLPKNETWDFAGKKITRSQWCVQTTTWFLNKLAILPTMEDVYQAAKSELKWYRSTGNDDHPNDVMFTGYYLPSLKAKRVKDSIYKHPIYRLPKNPKFSRAQIVAGALKGKGLEIAYASNPVDSFLLEIQGSGVLVIQNSDSTESQVMVNYAGKNGFAYTSLGKLMREAGISEDYISLQGIRKYFIDEHPELWEKFSNQNQSYVFFQESKTGPYGSSGVILTPGHSIAVDRKIFPMGAIALVQAEKPINETGATIDAWKPFTQFMISQDTGGAIKGTAHVDIFWGSGSYAELVAGHSKQIGQLFFCLVP